VRQLRQKELRDIKLGNNSSKIVSFHRNLNAIHDSDRERGTSIVANLNLKHKEFKKTKNPFQRRLGNDRAITLDDSSMMKLGQMTKEELLRKRGEAERAASNEVEGKKVGIEHIMEVLKKFFRQRLQIRRGSQRMFNNTSTSFESLRIENTSVKIEKA
jgi:hypothetical protein